MLMTKLRYQTLEHCSWKINLWLLKTIPKELSLKEVMIYQKDNEESFLQVGPYRSPKRINKLKFIAKKLKVSIDQVKKSLKEISHLEPKPGRSFIRPETRRRNTPRVPDIILNKLDQGYEILINDNSLPRLRINPQYRKLIKRKNIEPETKKYIKEKIGSALWIMKAITQRRITIQRITECILQVQQDFFTDGLGDHLKPLTLQDIAQRVERNESTVSRVVNNKYIQTPYGIFKLSYFFSSAFKTNNGEMISSEAIRSRVLELLEEEDKKHPLSDKKIAKLLSLEGINIARRTITKYREELKIPPSHLRKENN